MKWLITSKDEAINLDNICHIWIQKCPDGWFLMGEMIHNSEEVVLSLKYDIEDKCRQLLYSLFHNQPERSKREDSEPQCKHCGSKMSDRHLGPCCDSMF